MAVPIILHSEPSHTEKSVSRSICVKLHAYTHELTHEGTHSHTVEYLQGHTYFIKKYIHFSVELIAKA